MIQEGGCRAALRVRYNGGRGVKKSRKVRYVYLNGPQQKSRLRINFFRRHIWRSALHVWAFPAALYARQGWKSANETKLDKSSVL